MIEVPIGKKSDFGYHKFYLLKHTHNKTPKLGGPWNFINALWTNLYQNETLYFLSLSDGN